MTMAAATNKSLEKRLCAASNFIGLIPLISFNSSNVGNFYWSWILKDYIKVQEKKDSRCLVFPSAAKREIRHFHVVVVQKRQRNLQKSVMTFSLPSPSSLLKLPDIYATKIANAMNFVHKLDFAVKLARLT